jgi:hypothetical protein
MADRAIDRDLAIMLISAPIWIAGFAALIVAGWWNDRRSCRA